MRFFLVTFFYFFTFLVTFFFFFSYSDWGDQVSLRGIYSERCPTAWVPSFVILIRKPVAVIRRFFSHSCLLARLDRTRVRGWRIILPCVFSNARNAKRWDYFTWVIKTYSQQKTVISSSYILWELKVCSFSLLRDMFFFWCQWYCHDGLHLPGRVRNPGI